MTERHGESTLLWETVYNSILDQIQSGQLRPGAKLDTTAGIARAYNVSRATAAHALGHLRRRGFLTSRLGEGYYVARIPPR